MDHPYQLTDVNWEFGEKDVARTRLVDINSMVNAMAFVDFEQEDPELNVEDRGVGKEHRLRSRQKPF